MNPKRWLPIWALNSPSVSGNNGNVDSCGSGNRDAGSNPFALRNAMSVRGALIKYERATSDGFLLSNVVAARDADAHALAAR